MVNIKNIVFKGGLFVFVLGVLLFGAQANIARAAITLTESESLLAQADSGWASLNDAGRSVKTDVYQKAINAGMTHTQSLNEANYIYNRVPDIHSRGTAGELYSSVYGSGWTYDENGEITLNTTAVFQPAVPDDGDRTFNNIYNQIVNDRQNEREGSGSNNPGRDSLGSTNNGDDLMVPSHASTIGANSNVESTTCAQEGLEGVDFLVFHGPLVPCGINKQCANSGDRENDISVPCTLCHFIILIKNVFDLLLSLIITASLFMLTVAGVMYIVSSGGQLTGMAKGIIEKTLLGFGIFLLSWLLVYTLLNMLSVRDTVVGKGSRATWFQFECDTESSFYRLPEENEDTDVEDDNDEDTDVEDDNDEDTDVEDDNDEDTDVESVARSYDTGIQSQLSDAAPETLGLMSCMDRHLSTASANRVSSISDSAGIDRCVTNYSRPPCAHTRNSCHYGGRNCRGDSYAVDYGNEGYASEIMSAANSCGASSLNEGNHIHVSIGSENNCGCDDSI